MLERDVVLPTGALDSMDDAVDLAQYAEARGYAHATMGETQGWNMVSLLTRLATETDDIGLTNDVFSPWARSPALLGQTAVTLQELSEGRYRLGIGTSSPALVERWHGGEFDRPLRQVREAIEIVRQVYAAERLDYDGDFFQVDGLKLERATPDAPLRVDVAALGPKAVEMAGRFADGWVPQLFTPEGISERMDDFRRGAELGDRDPDEQRVSLTLRACALEDGDRARRVAREQVAFMLAVYGPYYRQSVADQGYEDATETIYERWHDGDKAGAVEAVPEELLTSAVAAGTPEEVRAVADEFAAVDGLDGVQVGFFRGMGPEERRATISALAP
jgi:coenzyme F420-dependent oxidoreductase